MRYTCGGQDEQFDDPELRHDLAEHARILHGTT